MATGPHSGFQWTRNEGVDASGNVSDNANESDILFLRLLVDPENATRPNTWLMWTDKTDDSGASREDLESGAATADHEFRLIWQIPDELQDGQWHELAIPLPPTTKAALDSAKAGVKLDGSPLDTPLDDLAMNWDYPGAWSNGGYGIGSGFGTDTNDPLWREFEWTNVKNFGVMFDTDQGGGPIYIDDMYIGTENTDLSAALNPPTAMTGVSFSPNGPMNVISWTHNPDYGAYNVYVSESPFGAGKTVDGAALVATVPFNADNFSVEHSFEVPHPSLAPLPLYYAVTSLSLFGVENTDVANSTGQISNDQLPTQPFIVQLTEEEGNTLFDNLQAGTVSPDGFPEWLVPFGVNASHSSAGDAPLPDNDDDNSADVWIGYTDFNELFIYAEVKDDVLEFGGENNNGAETWQWDSFEIGWGSYDVREIPGGSLIGGSPHQDYGRGSEPDYQFRVSLFDDAAGNLVKTSAFFSTLTGPDGEGEVQGGGTAGEPLTDDNGNTIGWKFLSLFPLDGIAIAGDQVFSPPGPNEVTIIPFNIALNDADGAGREHQMIWTTKGNAGPNWWNTPAQWMSVAVAGREASTVSNEEEDLPFEYALDQNYPNPFNPATTISFSLARTEAVKLSIYNVLGQKVATLYDGEQMVAGAHKVAFDARHLASGLYLYRLEAGTSFIQTKQMVLIK